MSEDPAQPNRRFYEELWPHAATLLRTAQILCGRRAAAGEAEDLVQETLLKAFRSLDAFRPGTDARAWLLTILRRTHIDRVRHLASRAEVVSLDSIELDPPGLDAPPLASDPSADALLDQIGDETLIEALRSLPPDICWTLLLVDVEGMDHADAAAVLAVPVGTVKSRAHRGRAMLRERLSLNRAAQQARSEG